MSIRSFSPSMVQRSSLSTGRVVTTAYPSCPIHRGARGSKPGKALTQQPLTWEELLGER